jgi:hypothetical protein
MMPNATRNASTILRAFGEVQAELAYRVEEGRPRPKRVWIRIPEEVRERIIKLALDRPELSPRELAMTACEGLNLQRLGSQMNVDMPWNPSRLEQRKGRIQRIGQLRDVIHVVNMRYPAEIVQEWPVDLLNVDAVILHRLDRVGDFEQRAAVSGSA